MHGAEIGEPARTDGRYQVQTDHALVGHEGGRRDVGFDGSEPGLQKPFDRLFAGRYVDAALSIAQGRGHLLRYFMPSSGRECLALWLAVGALSNTHRGAPAAILHLVDRTLSVSAFSFAHLFSLFVFAVQLST